MNSFLNYFTSYAGWVHFLTVLSIFLTWILPVLPQPWGGLVSSILLVLSFYHIGTAVNVGKAQGIRV